MQHIQHHENARTAMAPNLASSSPSPQQREKKDMFNATSLYNEIFQQERIFRIRLFRTSVLLFSVTSTWLSLLLSFSTPKARAEGQLRQGWKGMQ